MNRIGQGRSSPFGHKTQQRIFIDLDLLQYDVLWLVEGKWTVVLVFEPHKLVVASGGVFTDLKRG